MKSGIAKDVKTERTFGGVAGDIQHLQGRIDDLASLITLPVVWKERELPEIMGSLLDALLSILPLDFVYARLNDPEGGSPLETIRVAPRRQLPDLGRALENWLTRDTPALPQVPDRVSEGGMSIARFRVGLEDELGVFIAGSQQTSFPSKVDVLLLQAGANQAAIVLQRAQLLNERRRAIDHARRCEAEQKARLQAEAASRAKDEFLATVSHELRSPLNAILGWTHLLRIGKMGAAEVSHALEIVEHNARSQNKLINDLLDVSSIIAGNLRLDINPIEIAPVVESAVEAMRPTATVKGVHLHVALDRKTGMVFGDTARLQQVVYNLLSNAIKFTPKGGRIQVRLERVDSNAEITVIDSGVGISPDFLPHVFERYRQFDTSSAKKLDGLGLGLAIVLHLVELHEGTVQAYSDGIGKGATFVVKLPLL